MYLGHGEWGPVDSLKETIEHNNDLEREPDWICKWMQDNDEDIRIHQQVLRLGYSNRWGAQIPIKSKWNLELFSDLLINYEDSEVVEWLRYG